VVQRLSSSEVDLTPQRNIDERRVPSCARVSLPRTTTDQVAALLSLRDT
jgi:hypothetical protein